MKNYNLGNAVLENAKQQKNRKQKEVWNRHLKKSKKFEFQKMEQLNMERHFFFPKIIASTDFKDLEVDELAVYPVMCSLADYNKDDWFYRSKTDIAKMAGVTVPILDRAIEKLQRRKFELADAIEKAVIFSCPLLERSPEKVKQRGTQFWEYKVAFIRQEMIEDAKGQFFVFYTSIIDSGIWAKLTSRAKALYLAMRTVAKFDLQLYEDMERELNPDYQPYKISGDDVFADYRHRPWDPCFESLSALCRMVNIDRTNIENVLDQLEECGLIEVMNPGFMVYLRPRKYAELYEKTYSGLRK